MNRILWIAFFTILSTSTFSKSLNETPLRYADRYSIYNSLSFYSDTLDQQVFNYAFKGYFNVKDRNKIEKDNLLSVIDYSKSSVDRRFWVIDLKKRQLLFNEWVSHGKNTGNTYASRFSNKVSSLQSSLGFFLTGHTYDGKHKYSLKLHGLEDRYNSNAFKRGIVIHGADYVSQDFINRNNRLGRSYGCPAIRQEIKYDLISTIQNGSLLFSYYSSDNYLSTSRYLN